MGATERVGSTVPGCLGWAWVGWLWKAGFVFFRRRKAVLSATERAGLSVAAVPSRTAGLDAVGLAADHPALFAQWQGGGLRPTAITLAFDPYAHAGRGGTVASTVFLGEWVDVACGAQEPAVDRWEQGLLYPTWEQLCKLAVLTETPLGTLLTAPRGLEGLGGCVQEPLVFALRQSFHPAIVAATVDANPDQASWDQVGNAIDQAIADIQEQIAAKTDPLSVFIRGMLAESDQPHP